MGVQLETLCCSHLYLGVVKEEWNTRTARSLSASNVLLMMAVSNANRA